jgi:hypothetical protein
MINTLRDINGIHLSEIHYSENDHAYLDHGLDGLIIVNQLGKAPLSGLLRGNSDFYKTYGEDAIIRVEQIAKQLYECENPRIARIDFIDRKSDMKSICLTPTTEAAFYVKNFSKVIWSERRSEDFKYRNQYWRDYLYAMTYYSLFLMSKNPDVKVCGMTHLTGKGVYGGSEEMLDAIINFSKLNDNSSKIANIVFCYRCPLAGTTLIENETPDHREYPHTFGHNDEYQYDFVEVNLLSPFKWLQGI